MKDTDFLEASSYIRVQEKRLVTTGAIDRVADAADTKEALRMLSQSTDYDFTALKNAEDCEELLKQELRRVYRLVREQATGFPAVAEIPGCKYDYHNCKVALKAKHYQGRADRPYSSVSDIPTGEIEQYADKQDHKSGLPAHLKDAIDRAQSVFEQSGNPQDIDIVMDREMYGHMLRLCEELDNGFITGYVRMAVDFYNVKTTMRVKSMQKGTAFLGDCLVSGGDTDSDFFLANYGKAAGALAPAFQYKGYGDAVRQGLERFEKSGSYAELERLLDNRLIAYIRDVKYISFGAEVPFAYLLSKENEVRQIRIIVACKNNGISADILKERLRENYA